MRLVQRVSAWFGWAVLLGIGVLLILEVTTVIGAAWREWIGNAAVWMAQPPLASWLAALLGVALGLVALVILYAQFVPLQMTGTRTTVQKATTGSTRVAPIVIRRAAVARLKEIDGIVDAAPFSHDKRCLSIGVWMSRDTDASKVAEEARAALGESFWSTLGVPPNRIDLTLAYSTVVTPPSTTE